MSTVRTQLESMLVANGMFDSQAKAALESATPILNDLVDGYSISLDSSAAAYPKAIYNVLFLAIKPAVLEWIDSNIPQAWYRPMFI